MNFDSGTWWLAGLIIAALIAAVTYLIKVALFGRMDKCEKAVGQCVQRTEYEKDIKECTGDIKQIRQDYTPREMHSKDFDECRADIKAIREALISKEDFLREMSKFDRKIDRQDEKIDRLIHILLNDRGISNG